MCPGVGYLSDEEGVQPQLHADDLECVFERSVLRAARFTIGHVRLDGQELAPSKCVLVKYVQCGAQRHAGLDFDG